MKITKEAPPAFYKAIKLKETILNSSNGITEYQAKRIAYEVLTLIIRDNYHTDTCLDIRDEIENL